MTSVLGIDAAWTQKQPSGVALISDDPNGGWCLVHAAPSYRSFIARAAGPGDAEARPSGSPPVAAELLNAARLIGGESVGVVAIDMPLARSPIASRRVSDNAVSKAYGGRKCGTHTPNLERPGLISDRLRSGFEAAGYPLRTRRFEGHGLIEVYPHPALVELAQARERLPYKAGKLRTYWPDAPPIVRKNRLREQWSEIVRLLETEVAGVAAALPLPGPEATGVQLKAFEDMLDAVVCAWVGACALETRATPFGDDDSAIWIPASTALRITAHHGL